MRKILAASAVSLVLLSACGGSKSSTSTTGTGAPANADVAGSGADGSVSTDATAPSTATKSALPKPTVKIPSALPTSLVITDLKTGASFPTAHPLHPVEPRFRPSPAVTDILKQADVVLALDWIDLKGQYVQTLGKDAQIDAKIINVSLDRYSHNGWSMDHYGLPEIGRAHV